MRVIALIVGQGILREVTNPERHDERPEVGDGQLHTEPVYAGGECESNRIRIGDEESEQGKLCLRGCGDADSVSEYGIQLQQLEWGCERKHQPTYVDDQRQQDGDSQLHAEPVYIERRCESNRIRVGDEESGQGDLRLRGCGDNDGVGECGV